jgi:hypothetical protein
MAGGAVVVWAGQKLLKRKLEGMHERHCSHTESRANPPRFKMSAAIAVDKAIWREQKEGETLQARVEPLHPTVAGEIVG